MSPKFINLEFASDNVIPSKYVNLFFYFLK